jgi:hypothetical protein
MFGAGARFPPPRIPAGTRYVAVRATDPAGNLGADAA